MQLNSVDSVTDVRVLADKRERERRQREAARGTERAARLKNENLDSAKAHAAAVMKWGDIMERQLPQELASELSTQQSSCEGVLGGRDRILSRLEGELRAKDEEYVKALASQKEDMNSLITRMKAQFEEMRDGFESALVDVEAAFLSERTELVAAQKKEADALFDARKQMEGKYVEERLGREETWANDLYDLQAADLENYARLKTKLEGDIAILEQQLEHMKVGGVGCVWELPLPPFPTL